tara:strand:+ start:357 stop:608 length:252 start_codon:yes stop_codon:yes gene_type:complete
MKARNTVPPTAIPAMAPGDSLSSEKSLLVASTHVIIMPILVDLLQQYPDIALTVLKGWHWFVRALSQLLKLEQDVAVWPPAVL